MTSNVYFHFFESFYDRSDPDFDDNVDLFINGVRIYSTDTRIKRYVPDMQQTTRW